MIQIANTGYEVLSAGVISAFLAQVLKFIIFTFKTKRVNFKIFTTTGGMPSSHSAGVVALACAVGIIEGWSSVAFAIAAGFSLITMYDAAGLRRAAGKTAACLNRMMEDFYKHDVQSAGGKLKELLGHTPVEVIAGAIFGVAFEFFYHYNILL